MPDPPAGRLHAHPADFGSDALTPFGVNVQLGCGLGIKRIRGRPYLYFWVYEPRSWGSTRSWTYLGPAGLPRTRRRARELLLEYHIRVRREVDRRIERLQRVYVAGV